MKAICRACDSTRYHLSRLRPFDWPLYLVGFLPIRCKNCGKRTYRWRAVLRSTLATTPSRKDHRLNW